MAAPNPNPARITSAMWHFWTRFDSLEPTARLGGIYTDKPGYHDYRSGLPVSDYSRRDVAADRDGPADKASAFDLTLSDAAMKKYTTRLDTAARARDPRLYIGGVPIIREFIGTKDNKSVYCYVLTGGKPLGVGADAGVDYGRDTTHLWHIHISVIRRYCASAEAMDRLYSVMSGETLAAWRARTSKETFMSTPKDVVDEILGRKLQDGPNKGVQYTVGSILGWSDERHRRTDRLVTKVLAAVTELAGRDLVDEEELIAGVLAGLTPERLAAGITAAGLTPQAIAAAIPNDMAGEVVDEIVERLNNDPAGDEDMQIRGGQ